MHEILFTQLLGYVSSFNMTLAFACIILRLNSRQESVQFFHQLSIVIPYVSVDIQSQDEIQTYCENE